MNQTIMKLKMHLMQEGIKVSTPTLKKLQGIIFDDYVTCSGLMFKLLGNNKQNKSAKYLQTREYVTANINSKSTYSFHIKKDGSFLIKQGAKIVCDDVGLCKPAKNQTESSCVAIHGDRIRISLIKGCVGDCKFCGLNQFPYSATTFDEIVKYVNQIIAQKGQVTRLFFTGGNPRESDFNKVLLVLEKVINYYKKKGIQNFDYMFSPRGTCHYINQNSKEEYEKLLNKLKQIGVTTVAIDMEIYDKKLLARYAPFKSKIGRENYLLCLKTAVKIFGEGNVRSNIIIGLEPKISSLKAVESLAKIKAQPCLSPYEPFKGLPEVQKPTWKDLYDVFVQSNKICKKYGVKLAPSLFATDTHNSVASASPIPITKIEQNMFCSTLDELKK